VLLKIEANDVGFQLEGEIDMATANDFAEFLREAGENPDQVVLDFSGVSFMDSSGLRVILEAAGRREGCGSLVILHPTSQVQRVLDISIPGGTPGLEVRP
jgi:anti-sigma B factor antagonist